MEVERGKQIGGFFFSPDWIEDPRKATPYIKEMVEHGYFAAVAFVRHQKRSVLDKSVHDAVKAVVEIAHGYGLKILLDTDHCWWGPAFVEAHPETALWAIQSMEVTAFEGHFEFPLYFPRMQGQIVFEEISAVFRPRGNEYEQIPVSNLNYEWMNFQKPALGILIKGKLTDGYSGKLIFYVAVKTFGVVDVAHPLYLKAQEELLDTYADVPLDGFTWDEPGKGIGDLSCFKAGAGFLAFFKEFNGYELRPKLIYLDHLDGTPKAIKVRYDYYRTLSEMNFIAQERHNRYAKKIFGEQLIFGTHQTFSGIPADLASGVMDYFHLGKVLTAAWTDGGWDNVELKYPAFHFMLAEGIKKELGLRDAYYNDWAHTIPTIENMRFANRFKMLFHINWFNHCFSDFTEGLVNFRHEPLKSFAKQDVANLDRFDELVKNDFIPYSEVALLYTWEGIATAPKWMTRLFYTALVNASLHLVDRGIFADIMSPASIIRAEIEKGYFNVGNRRYKVLVVPFAYAITEALYQKIIQISEAGIPVIFFGPPPEFIAESGKSIAGDFAKRVGMKPFTFKQYEAAYAEHQSLPSLSEWEPSWVDFSYPVSVTEGEKFEDREGKILYIKSPAQPLYYMPLPDPREDLMNLVESFVELPGEVFAERAYYRFYINPRKKESIVIVAVAKARISSFAMVPDKYGSHLRPPIKENHLKALFRLAEGELSMVGGTWCAVRLDKGQIGEIIGDCPNIHWKGEKIQQAL